MGQLLVTLIVPPIVGVVTDIVVRRIWDRDENGAEAVSRREPSAVTQAEEKPTVPAPSSRPSRRQLDQRSG
jgi:hypothetical protein